MKASGTKELGRALFELTDGKDEAEIKKILKAFAAHLSKKRMLGKGNEIIAEYRKLYNEAHGIKEATVTLTERLPEKTRLRLREALKKRYKAREVHMLEKVDARIIGGLKVQIGDEVYDGTIATALKQLQAQLLK